MVSQFDKLAFEMAIRLPCMHVWPTWEILICGIVHTLHMIANKKTPIWTPLASKGMFGSQPQFAKKPKFGSHIVYLACVWFLPQFGLSHFIACIYGPFVIDSTFFYKVLTKFGFNILSHNLVASHTSFFFVANHTLALEKCGYQTWVLIKRKQHTNVW